MTADQRVCQRPCGCRTTFWGRAICEERHGSENTYCLHERQLEEERQEGRGRDIADKVRLVYRRCFLDCAPMNTNDAAILCEAIRYLDPFIEKE